jgi:hypothetical protein
LNFSFWKKYASNLKLLLKHRFVLPQCLAWCERATISCVRRHVPSTLPCLLPVRIWGTENR